MAVPAITITAAMDGARAVLPPPADFSGRVHTGTRLLACAAVMKVGLLSPSTAQQAFGFKRKHTFSEERLRKFGVTEDHISRLAQALVVAGLPVFRRDAMGWNEKRTKELARLAKLRHSASEIGNALGVSRSAVCSAAARYGIQLISQPRTVGPAKPKAKPAPERTLRLVKKADGPLPEATIPAGPLARPWEQREARQCAWPYTQPDGGVWSCCRPIGPDPRSRRFQYCDAHLAEAFDQSEGSKPVSSNVPVNFARAA